MCRYYVETMTWLYEQFVLEGGDFDAMDDFSYQGLATFKDPAYLRLAFGDDATPADVTLEIGKFQDLAPCRSLCLSEGGSNCDNC